MIGGRVRLVDIAIDTVPRVIASPGVRALSPTRDEPAGEDVDAPRGVWEKTGEQPAALSAQAAGPITLAAELELSNGTGRSLTRRRCDPRGFAGGGIVGAIAAASGTPVVGAGRRADRRALISAPPAGRIGGVTALTPVHPVDETLAISLYNDLVASVEGSRGHAAAARPTYRGKCCSAVLFTRSLARYRNTRRRRLDGLAGVRRHQAGVVTRSSRRWTARETALG